MLTCLVPALFTFYIQDVLKLKNNSDAKGLKTLVVTRVICCPLLVFIGQTGGHFFVKYKVI